MSSPMQTVSFDDNFDFSLYSLLQPDTVKGASSPSHDSDTFSGAGSPEHSLLDMNEISMDFDKLLNEVSPEDPNLFSYLMNYPEEAPSQDDKISSVSEEELRFVTPSPSLSGTSSTSVIEQSGAQDILQAMSQGQSVKIRVVHPAPPPTTRSKRATKTLVKKEEEVFEEEVLERNQKNAIQAKFNREKKKMYVQGLEESEKTLKQENTQLKQQNLDLVNNKKSLEDEVDYLKSVLANQSTLSSLLKNIGNVQGVSLTTSFEASRKRSLEHDHDYNERPAKKLRGKKSMNPKSATVASGGICLHVANENVSLEFCRACAKMATGGEKPKETS